MKSFAARKNMKSSSVNAAAMILAIGALRCGAADVAAATNVAATNAAEEKLAGRWVDLPSPPAAWSVDGEGKVLAALRSTKRAVGSPANPDKGEQDVVLADLEKMEVAWEVKVGGPASAVAVDAENVYVGQTDADAILILSRKNGEQTGRLFVKGKVVGLWSAGGKRLIVRTQERGEGVRVTHYSLPDHKVLKEETTGTYVELPGYWPKRVAGGWIDGKVFWDEGYEKAKMILPASEMITLRGTLRLGEKESHPPILRWGVFPKGSTFLRGESLVGKFTTPVSGVLWGIPAAVEMDTPKGARTVRQVSVMDLFTGAVVKKVKVMDEAMPTKEALEYRMSEYGVMRAEMIPMVEMGEKVLFQSGKRIFVLTDEELGKKELSPPLHFEMEDGVRVLEEGKSQVKVAAVNGRGEVKYRLLEEAPWASIDEKTGVIDVDIAKAELEVRAILMGTSKYVKVFNLPGSNAKPTKGNGYFKMLTGKESKGQAAMIVLSVAATDAEKMEVTREFGVLVDFAMKAEEFPAELKASKGNAAKEASTTEEMEKKIEELSKRNQDLEAQVKMLKELMAKPTATQP